MADNQTKRNVDIVMCFDATGSMAGVLDNMKENAQRLYSEILEKLTELGSEIDGIRIKVIAFRDYGCDEEPMKISDFFELPDDNTMFQDYLAAITPEGGGDGPENGLEALYYAMKSDFVTAPKDRQIILMFTDADALPLGERKDSPKYPTDMVNEAGFINTWLCTDQNAGLKLQPRNERMAIFAPSGTYYESFAGKVEHVAFTPVAAGSGLNDVDFSQILNIIVSSVGR